MMNIVFFSLVFTFIRLVFSLFCFSSPLDFPPPKPSEDLFLDFLLPSPNFRNTSLSFALSFFCFCSMIIKQVAPHTSALLLLPNTSRFFCQVAGDFFLKDSLHTFLPSDPAPTGSMRRSQMPPTSFLLPPHSVDTF